MNAFATKIDLVFATKEDLKAFATKEDLKIMELSICNKISDQIGQLRGEYIVLMRKEDNKTLQMADILNEKKLFDVFDLNKVATMEPFPRPKMI